MSKNPDETQKHFIRYRTIEGESLSADTVFELHQRKQEVVLPPVKAKFIEHQSYC